MPVRLAQVCLFKEDGSKLRRFCEIVSGRIEFSNDELVAFHMGGASVAHHVPAGELTEDDVLVTLQLESEAAVDRIHASLVASGLDVDDTPENTDWGWRVFYFRVAKHLVFEVGAPRPKV